MTGGSQPTPGLAPSALQAALAEDVYQRLLACYGPQGWWPGVSAEMAPSPFEVMVGAILAQNTAWTNAARAVAGLQAAECLSAKAILACPEAELAELLRPSGYFNIKAARLRAFCQWYARQGDIETLQAWPTPALRAALLAIRGIGPETADSILLYALRRPVFVIDAYTKRLFARLGACPANIAYETLRARFEAILPTDVALFNEYHALIVRHGSSVCRPRPHCDICWLSARCSRWGVT